ncbi:hypothetical protein JYG23_12490 [Sedimentibacter sp. zth1]|uniref:hypothetical protein n=1 Tax=Sedimentibacter sp. zth1 TaxID=2816908 RepID=UPI001A9235CD|nr:hypothetical protein [Sedimentibacter sp. zth1]QSX05486.1 hypothetical protein JYG23_12490 [Sedimentibacter sp. zth1]
MNRLSKIKKYDVTVYKDIEDGELIKTGNSQCVINSEMNDIDIQESISDAYYSASFAINPYFELPKPINEPHINIESCLANFTLEESATKMSEALFKNDVLESAFVNSAEIFVKKIDTKIVSSENANFLN